MVLLNGKSLAQKILQQVKTHIASLPTRPLLIDILVGDDPVALSFINIKKNTARQIGADFELAALPADAHTAEVVEKVSKQNKRPEVCGLIVQLPLPPHIDRAEVLNVIDPRLDIDCIGKANLSLFYAGTPRFLPPTAGAILYMLESTGVDLSQKVIGVVGQGDLVGRPISYLLKSRGWAVKIADRNTPKLSEFSQSCDVLISGTGQPRLITGSMIKAGAVVIDAGTAESEGSIVGDVDFDSVSRIAGYISPVPGGVGPLTVAMLYKNLAEACKRRQ